MWEHGPKLIREVGMVLFLEVMLCSKPLVVALGLRGSKRTSKWYTKIELILVSVDP